MMRLRTLVLTAALALVGAGASHALASVTMETEWRWTPFFSSFTSVTSKTFDPAGYGSVGYSSVTANIIGFTYTIYPVGGNANYTITQTTKTPNAAVVPTGFNSQAPFGLAASVAVLSTSTLITVPNGTAYNGKFQALTINPVFTFSGLSTAATYYIWLEAGTQRKP